MQYVWLLICWILYCLLHSILAASDIKSAIQKYAGDYFRYYRIAYSIFATVSLVALLLFHFSFENQFLVPASSISMLSGVILIVPGILLMGICIRKYFFHLSGIDVFFKHKASDTKLHVEGIHRYVRHPLYLGTLLMVWGLILFLPSLHHLLAGGVITLYVFAGIYWEEKKLMNVFGEEYKNYTKQVPMLWPKFNKKCKIPK